MNINEERLPPNAKGQLWYPHAKFSTIAMETHGTYRLGYPRGAVIHYTAGRHPGGLGSGIKNGYCYLLVDSTGLVHQAHPINEWGYHAGKSSWSGLSGTVSDDLIGIEVACAGLVEKVGDKFKAWFHHDESEFFSADQVRYSESIDNVRKGYYHKYTEAQERELINLLLWLYHNDPAGCFSFDLVVGHDEVAKGRKVDPGASLSVTMPAFRKLLKKKAGVLK